MDNNEVKESVRSGNPFRVHWKDKHDVYVMSIIPDNGVTEIQRKRGDKVAIPNRIIAYNKYMAGVDKCDQYLNYYLVGRKAL